MPTPESIIMFKPDAQDIRLDVGEPIELHKLGAALLVSAGLEIIDHSSVLLMPDDVYSLYKKRLVPNPEYEAIWGLDWQENIIAHISSAPVESYLLSDAEDRAIPKTKELKNFLRRHYACADQAVQNIAHVPDADEMTIAKRILFDR